MLATRFVKFKNGVEIAVGQSQGADQAALFREQIRYTVEEHFRKQTPLEGSGNQGVVAVLHRPRGEFCRRSTAVARRSDASAFIPASSAQLFDEAFEKLKIKYPDFAGTKAGDVREKLFRPEEAARRSGGCIDSTSGQSARGPRRLQPHHERQGAAAFASRSRWLSFSRIARCGRAGIIRMSARFARLIRPYRK